MSEALTVTAPGLARDLVIAAVHSTIVDVPMVRRHKLPQTSVTAQSYVIAEPHGPVASRGRHPSAVT